MSENYNIFIIRGGDIWAVLDIKNPLEACANTDIPSLQFHPLTGCCYWQGAIPGAGHAGKAYFSMLLF